MRSQAAPNALDMLPGRAGDSMHYASKRSAFNFRNSSQMIKSKPSFSSFALALGLFGLMTGGQAAYAAAPVISSASLSNGVLTVSGSNFGTKVDPNDTARGAAPYYFQDFSNLADGANNVAAGLTWNENSYCPNTTKVISTDGVGGKSISMTSDASSDPLNGWSPHLGLAKLPAGTQGVFVSHWIRFNNITGGTMSDIMQWKGPRAGVYSSTPLSPSANYAANPKLSSQMYIQTDGYWTGSTAADGTQTGGWTDAPVASGQSGGLGDIWFNSARPSTFGFYSSWIQRDSWLKFNDVGSANGEVSEVINGAQVQNLKSLTNRHFSSESMQYVQVIPGIQFTRTKAFEIRVSRIYIDTTQARVFLGNASTLSASTGRFLLPPTAWANGSINADHATNIPAGYKWVYVANSAGEVNATGIAFTSGTSTTAAPSAPTIQGIQVQ